MTPPGSTAVEFTRTRSTSRDRLPDYAALVGWAEREGVISRESAAGLTRSAAAHPRLAARAHGEAIALRESVYRLLGAAGGDRPPAPEDLATLNEMLRRSAAHRSLVGDDGGYSWRFDEAPDAQLDAPLWVVAQSAAELLTSDWIDRVGVCAADTCRWLFIDESRNRSRRWCDMSDCGTRAKVRRFRARKKKTEGD